MKKDTANHIAEGLEKLLPTGFTENYPFPLAWGGSFTVWDGLEDIAKEVSATFRLVKREITDEAFRNGDGKTLEFTDDNGMVLTISAVQVDNARTASVAWFKFVRHDESKRRSDWGNWILEVSTHPETIKEKVDELKSKPELASWL